jgi:hypothetical protein
MMMWMIGRIGQMMALLLLLSIVVGRVGIAHDIYKLESLSFPRLLPWYSMDPLLHS